MWFYRLRIHVLYTDPQRKGEKFFEDIFIVTLLQFFSDSSPKRRKYGNYLICVGFRTRMETGKKTSVSRRRMLMQEDLSALVRTQAMQLFRQQGDRKSVGRERV